MVRTATWVMAFAFISKAASVLEKVPPNTPVDWCSRMVICRKHNREPLNAMPIRQSHPTNSPLQAAMTVPHGVKYSTRYACNSSVAIREEDRDITTFSRDTWQAVTESRSTNTRLLMPMPASHTKNS